MPPQHYIICRTSIDYQYDTILDRIARGEPPDEDVPDDRIIADDDVIPNDAIERQLNLIQYFNQMTQN